jgi:hypothetical protein
MKQASRPLRSFAVHPRPPHWPAEDASRRRSCIAPFLIAMFRYPPSRASAVPPGPIGPGDAPGVLVPSQSCSCMADFRAFPLVFPHMPSVNFHLDVLFFSRDRPTDILFRGSGEIAWPPPRRFTHCKLKLGRSRKFTSASGSLSATQSALPPQSARRRDPALGLASFRSVGHHSGAPARPRNTHEPSVSARPLPACYPLLGFVAIISQMHRSLVAACIRCIAGPSASSRD